MDYRQATCCPGCCVIGPGRSSFHLRTKSPWLNRMPQLVQELFCLCQAVHLSEFVLCVI